MTFNLSFYYFSSAVMVSGQYCPRAIILALWLL